MFKIADVRCQFRKWVPFPKELGAKTKGAESVRPCRLAGRPAPLRPARSHRRPERPRLNDIPSDAPFQRYASLQHLEGLLPAARNAQTHLVPTDLGCSESDRKSMMDPFLNALKPWHGIEYTSIPDHINVSVIGVLATTRSSAGRGA